MKKIISLMVAIVLLAGSADVMAQTKPRGGKKKVSPFIEGRQKVHQDDYDTIWKFTNFNTKDTKIYYLPFDYANINGIARMKKPNWEGFSPVVNYLQKSSRATATLCAVFAVNPEIEDPKEREALAEKGREEAMASLNAFEEWKVKQEMRNKLQYQVAEIDYKYFKGANYYNEQREEAVIHVGMLMYFGSKKKPIFTPDTVSRTFDDIRFFPNDATIVESWLPALDTIANYLKENERKSVLITGYADNQGTEAYCIGLSRQRATEVKKALLMRGVDKDRIEIEAKGDADPIGDNETREGRIKNNRVSIKIL
ncbi:MAG: OmpA family protein [Bacteroidales bacterium]|nr:OmpA family protein [Bacteroidales bacterium]